jgi:hypothetical protein
MSGIGRGVFLECGGLTPLCSGGRVRKSGVKPPHSKKAADGRFREELLI